MFSADNALAVTDEEAAELDKLEAAFGHALAHAQLVDDSEDEDSDSDSDSDKGFDFMTTSGDTDDPWDEAPTDSDFDEAITWIAPSELHNGRGRKRVSRRAARQFNRRLRHLRRGGLRRGQLTRRLGFLRSRLFGLLGFLGHIALLRDIGLAPARRTMNPQAEWRAEEAAQELASAVGVARGARETQDKGGRETPDVGLSLLADPTSEDDAIRVDFPTVRAHVEEDLDALTSGDPAKDGVRRKMTALTSPLAQLKSVRAPATVVPSVPLHSLVVADSVPGMAPESHVRLPSHAFEDLVSEAFLDAETRCARLLDNYPFPLSSPPAKALGSILLPILHKGPPSPAQYYDLFRCAVDRHMPHLGGYAPPPLTEIRTVFGDEEGVQGWTMAEFLGAETFPTGRDFLETMVLQLSAALFDRGFHGRFHNLLLLSVGGDVYVHVLRERLGAWAGGLRLPTLLYEMVYVDEDHYLHADNTIHREIMAVVRRSALDEEKKARVARVVARVQ